MAGGQRRSTRLQRRSRARRVLALALAALVAGCIPHERATGGPRVMVTGDSTTALAADALRDVLLDALPGDHRVTFRHQRGQTILDMLDDLAAQVHHPAGVPEAALVNLGTNDVLQANGSWRAHFDAMVALLEPVGCVNLVTVNEHIADASPLAAAINDAIDEVVAADPEQFHRIEWNVDWAAEMGPGGPDDPAPHHYSIYVKPGVFPGLPDGGWVGDGLHQSPEGSVELARRYQAALVEHCGISG